MITKKFFIIIFYII